MLRLGFWVLGLWATAAAETRSMNNERYTLRPPRAHDSLLSLNSDEVVGGNSQPMHARLRVGGCSRSSLSTDSQKLEALQGGWSRDLFSLPQV
jgi:hypothetical protein